MTAGRPAIVARAGAFAVIAAAIFPSAAFAADPAPVTTVTSVPIFADTLQLLTAFALLFVFGMFVVGLVLLFVNQSQSRYLRAAIEIARLGGRSKPTSISALAGPEGLTLGEGGEPALEISGSSQLIVGTAATFSASLDGQPATAAAWSVEPSGSATLSSREGASVQVLATVAGQVTIRATVESRVASLTVEAIAPAIGATDLPFLGGGWGAIIVSVVLIAVIAALGLSRILGGEATASLLGTLAGYLFGIRGQAGGGGRAADTTPASGGNSPTS